MRRIKGYIGIGFVCLFYWIFDSIWSYFSFELNLKNMIFSEPASYIDTFLLRVPPYQIVSRLTVVVLFATLGILIIEFIIRRQAAESERKEAHDTFLTVLNGVDATIYAADMQNHEILFMNQVMIEKFGDNLSGQVCYEVFRHSDKVCEHCPNPQLVDESGNPKGLVVWEGRNPITNTWYVNYDRAIKWIDGRIVHLQIATDITQFKKLQEKQAIADSQLRQAQKMEAIGGLAGGIAHDFNNLLMGVLGRTSLMAMDLKPSHAQMEHINAIEEYVRSATNLTKQLLGFARAGKYEIKPVDINEIISHSADMFGRTHKAILIHGLPHSESIIIEADRRQIEQVLLNLFLNAWQAMPDGGDIHWKTSVVSLDGETCQAHEVDQGRFGRMSVTDTGIGIDKPTQEKIFNPFFTTKEKGRGTGLGLASVYGIVKNHDGFITVDSETGQGATFNIFLPVSDKMYQRETTPDGKLIKGSETILLVDDEEVITEVGRAMLEKLGYTVWVAKSGREAIQIVTEKRGGIDLVILDLIMPEMDGSKTFDRIRDIYPEIPVMISSGYAVNGQAINILDRGGNGFIQKPFSVSELSQGIRKILDRV